MKSQHTHLGSVSFLLQTLYALLQRAAGSLLLLQRRLQLLLQAMALGCQVTHLNLNSQTQALLNATGMKQMDFYSLLKGIVLGVLP